MYLFRLSFYVVRITDTTDLGGHVIKMIKRLIVLCIIMIIMIIMPMAPVLYGSQYEDNIKRSYPLDPSGSFVLDTPRGNIKLSTHRKKQVDIYVAISSDMGGEAGKVKISFGSKGGIVKVSAGKQLLNANVNLEYTVKVPENLKDTQLITRLGEIKARGKFAGLTLKTTTGEIDFRGNAGKALLQSANGDIEFDIRGAMKGDWTAKNINGGIKAEIRSASHFSISGYSATGSIRSEFKSVTKIGPNGSQITGKINDGTHLLRLETINGDIKILRQ